jgi:DNA invertase Pin-like site-specific DNA recombinase
MTKRLATNTTEGKPWAIYLRLSKAEAAEDAGKTKAERIALTNVKLDGHRAEVEDWLTERGLPWDPALIFRDPALSAWKRGVRRPDWERMMILARAGELAGIAIVAIDRFTRDIPTMEDLIDLAAVYKVNIGGPRGGNLDLTTYEGIVAARGATQQAANESLATSFRLKGTMRRKMKAGQPMGGGRSYGFDAGGMVQRPDEVAVLREVARRFLAGEPLQQLADDLNARGLRTTRDGEWNGRNLGRMLGLARYGGHVEHHGEIVGTIKGDPVLDADTFADVQAVLMSRKLGRRATSRFVLTGVLRCGSCDRTMNGAAQSRPKADGTYPRVYRCPPQLGGCSRTVRAENVEDVVGVHMRAVLSTGDVVARLVAEDNQLSASRVTALGQLQAIEDRLETLEGKLALGHLGQPGGITEAAYERGFATYDAARRRLQAELAELAPVAAGRRFDGNAEWDNADAEERRTLMLALGVTPYVLPLLPDSPRNRFDARRVTFTKPA